MVWNFIKHIKAKSEKEAKKKFKEFLDSQGLKRYDFKIMSIHNTNQYPETFSIHYRGRKLRGRGY